MAEKFSILCPAYNHERYIPRLLASVKAQSDPDWELVVVDDNSPDHTADIVDAFCDSRVHLIRRDSNRGMAAGINDAFGASKGTLISLIGSDDELEPDFVKEMRAAFAADPEIGVAYTPLKEIDLASRPIGKSFKLPVDIPREQLFAELFVHRNCLPSPGMTIRRTVMAKLLPLEEGLLQHADSILNLQLAFSQKMYFGNKPLVRYRVAGNGKSAGASNRSQITKTRESVEVAFLLSKAVSLIGNDVSSLARMFGHLDVVRGHAILPEHIPFWLGRIALTSDQYDKRVWGLRQITACMNIRANALSLQDQVGFQYKHLLELTAIVHGANRYFHKFKKYRARAFQLALALFVVLVALFATLAILILK